MQKEELDIPSFRSKEMYLNCDNKPSKKDEFKKIKRRKKMISIENLDDDNLFKRSDKGSSSLNNLEKFEEQKEPDNRDVSNDTITEDGEIYTEKSDW